MTIASQQLSTKHPLTNNSLKQRTAQGLIWGGLSNGMMQLLGAVFGVILLRYLTPADYGKMAALVVFINVGNSLQESGFTAALANRRDAAHEDYNAVFWFNVIVGTVIYAVLFAAAPAIARFYREPVLQPLARFAFVGLWVSSLGICQQAWLFSHLRVKHNSLINLTALIVSNALGIAMVMHGLAFWGLAAQSVAYIAVGTLLRWHVSPWRPTLHIDLRPAWSMFGFSSKLLVNSLAFQLNNNAFGLLLNRFYPGGHVAGVYSNARKWDDMAIATVGGMVQGVAQPVLRRSLGAGRGDAAAVFRKLLRFTCFVSFPALLGLGLIAEDFIVLLVGERWHESAMLLALLCVWGAFSPVVTLFSNLVIACERSTINMAIGVVNCALVWGGIVAIHAAGGGLWAMVTYYVVLNIAWLLVWQACAHSLIRLSWRHAVADTVPFFLFALAVMVATWWLTRVMPLSWLRVAARVALAAALYVGLLYVAGARILRQSIDYIFHRAAPAADSHAAPQQPTSPQP
ncbi:MAG: lipopolysaccharide biosynthesis protein [Bacteroidaceae bacterium]|nr:lipopolysaccharide biosynthesis protein [Bacteroidaceae bacterium]